MKILALFIGVLLAFAFFLLGNDCDWSGPGPTCCKVCKDSCACGDSCIPCNQTCHVGPGCACNESELATEDESEDTQ
jgi:hypothetical protein